MGRGICRCCDRRISTNATTCPHCDEPDPDGTIEKVHELLEIGNHRMAAIKLLAETWDWELSRAVDYVDKIGSD